MSRAKRIHDKHVTQFGHATGKIFIVALFTRIEAYVFTQDDFAGFNGKAIQPVFLQTHRRIQQTGQVSGNRRH